MRKAFPKAGRVLRVLKWLCGYCGIGSPRLPTRVCHPLPLRTEEQYPQLPAIPAILFRSIFFKENTRRSVS